MPSSVKNASAPQGDALTPSEPINMAVSERSQTLPVVDNEPALFSDKGDHALSHCTADGDAMNPHKETYNAYRISEVHRFFLLLIASIGCLLASFSYTFGIFATKMMIKAQIDMSQLTTISTVMLVFSYFTLPYAIVYDNFGPKPILIIGTLLLPLGCLLMALTFNDVIPANTVNFSVFLGILGGGCIIFDIGTVVSVLSWFPTRRGPVVAIVKTFAGLGAALVGTIEHAFFETNTSGFFFFMMGTALGLGLLTIFATVLPPYHLTASLEKSLSAEEKEARLMTRELFMHQAPPLRRMAVAFGFVLFFIVFLPTQSAIVTYANLDHKAAVAFAVVVIVVLALYPIICLPLNVLGGMGTKMSVGQLHEQRKQNQTSHRHRHHAHIEQPRDGDETEFSAEATAAEEKMTTGENDSGEAQSTEMAMTSDADELLESPQIQTTFVQNLLSVRLWAIFLVCLTSVGAQLVIIFNYSFIAAALRGKPTDEKFKTLLTVLNGVGSAIGRLLLSGFEVWSQRKHPSERLAITSSLFMPCGCTLLGLVLYITLPGDGLAFAHFVICMGSGSAAAAAVLVFRGMFAKEPAKHYNFGFLAAMVSAILLNRLAYGQWYFETAKREGISLYQPCLVKKCVMMPMLLLIGLCGAGLLGGAYVHIDYTRFCRRVWQERGVLDAEGRAQLSSPSSQETDATICSEVEKLEQCEVGCTVMNSVESDTPLDVAVTK